MKPSNQNSRNDQNRFSVGSASAGAKAADASARQRAMAVFARATSEELEAGLVASGCAMDCADLRTPETGLVMARGRISGTGAPFNVGEVTVTRAAVRNSSGQTGFSYVLGRDQQRARLAAIADAYWQGAGQRDLIEKHVITPVAKRLAAEKQRRREEVAPTRVDFFTMARGED